MRNALQNYTTRVKNYLRNSIVGTTLILMPTEISSEGKVSLPFLPLNLFDTIKSSEVYLEGEKAVSNFVVRLLNFSNYTEYIRNEAELLHFVRYIKTQQSIFGDDCKAVIRTMMNRLEEHNVTWTQYYETPRINNSRSIKLMHNRPNWPTIDAQSTNDSLIIDYIKRTNAGLTEPFPSDILYFESFKTCPNRPPHLCSKLKFKFTHKFYSK